MLPTFLSLSSQEQNPDFWAPGGDSAGCFSVLLPRHGGGPPHVPAQVSVSVSGPSEWQSGTLNPSRIQARAI